MNFESKTTNFDTGVFVYEHLSGQVSYTYNSYTLRSSRNRPKSIRILLGLCCGVYLMLYGGHIYSYVLFL